MKIVFFGTPEFACIPLKALINSRHKVVAVVCATDKPNSRNNKMIPCAVKQFAEENRIKVLQYQKVRQQGVEDLKKLNPDIMVTAAYGQIISQEIIDIAKHNIINVHPSILPKYRGPAPVQWAIMNGEKVTGVTIMKTEAGIDDGDILLKSEIAILDNETFAELNERLWNEGASLLLEALDKIENGTITRTPQKHSEMTYFPLIKDEHCKIDFKNDSQKIVNQIRGLAPVPTAFFVYKDIKFKIFKAKKTELKHTEKCGTVLEASSKKGLIIACGKNETVEILELLAPNGKKMAAKAYLCGNSFTCGEVID